MTYRIRGLEPGLFEQFRAMDEESLANVLTRRVTAGPDGRYPCRVSLRDAEPGDELFLTNFVNHAVDTPYRNAFAIYVRKDADKAAEFVDSLPPILEGRTIALRGYAADGSLHAASLAVAGDVDAAIRALFADDAVAFIDAHNAMHGCFAARIERHDGASHG